MADLHTPQPIDLGFANGQYNLILSIFFVPYVLFAPPVAMLGKKYGPARVLPSKSITTYKTSAFLLYDKKL